MDSSGKRLAIALTTVVVALALNAAAVVTGIADHAYGRLFESESSTRVAEADAESSGPALMVEATECANPGNGRSLRASLPPRQDSSMHMC